MSCPTCGHTMQRLACQLDECRGTFWCPRCGTLLIKLDFPGGGQSVTAPALVERCRDFAAKSIEFNSATYDHYWHRLGIGESIRTPEERGYGK